MQTKKCEFCKNEIGADSDFCPYCGTLIIGEVFCINHNYTEAKGVCLICEEPYCAECGRMVSGKFFCRQHEDLEVYEGMAKVYSSEDYLQCTYVIGMLKGEGIEAVMFNRKSTFMYMRGYEFSALTNSKTQYLSSEVRVMVPFSQFLQAQELVKSLDVE